LDMAQWQDVPRVAVHAFLDGRDTPPRSAEASLAALAQRCENLPNVRLASVSGRYYAMDRDQRWDRVERAWRAIIDGEAEFRAVDGIGALQQAYARGENDEFVKPTVIGAGAPVRDGD